MASRRNLVYLVMAGAVLLAGAAIVGVVAPPSGLVMSPPTSTPLPPPAPAVTPPASLAELADDYPELAHILTDPELDSVYKEFLLAYQEGGTEAALELARQRGLLTPEGDIRVTLLLDTEDSTALQEQLEAVGVTVVAAYEDRINVAVPMALVEAELQSADPGGIFHRLTGLDHVIAVRLPEVRTPDQGGVVAGEGVGLIGAGPWHAAGLTGQGIRVGILDLGFADYQSLLGVELPDQVTVQTFGWIDRYEVHGTACAEIVHEIAPGAELFFAWYDGSDPAFGEAIDWLLAEGVQVISHSAGGLVGPRDGSEWDARQVDRVAEQGVLWINSSGNDALSHYRGSFADSDGDGVHEFAPGEESLTLFVYGQGYLTIALQWDDVWDAANQDYNLFLYDVSGNLLASSQNAQAGGLGHDPVERIQFDPSGAFAYLSVVAGNATGSATLDIYVDGAEVAYPQAGYSIRPPGDAVGSLTVGAVNWWDDTLADYSSQGPTDDGRLKPEISAPTGVSGVVYGSRGFDGTSASAPHVAGAAALVWQAFPEFGRQQVSDYLLSHAADLGPAGPDTGYGYGRLQLPGPPLPGSEVATPQATVPLASPAPLEGGLSTPTPVTYVTPVVAGPSSGDGGMRVVLSPTDLLLGGMICAGGGLLLVGGVGLLLLWLGARWLAR